jgi:tetratricopeptide (TPR) repeat protein
VARVWLELGKRFNDDAARDRGKQVLRASAERPGGDPQAAFLLASLESDAGNFAAAEELYRRVLKQDPHQPDAQNNLAYLLMVRGGGGKPQLEEARALAAKAVERSPNTAAFHDTLARIAQKLGLREQALTSFRAALALEPANLEALVGLADALSSGPQADRDKAAELLHRIDALLNKTANPSLPETLKQELNGVRQRVTQAQ